jgi:CRP-like cAMP-binding protein
MSTNGRAPKLDPRALLRKVTIFSHLDDAGIGDIERFTEMRDYPAGAVIVGLQDPGDSLYVLARGKVKVVLYGESGREIILSIFKSPGDFFGEMSLLDNQPRSANVIAMEPSSLLMLQRQSFAAHLQAHPQTALNVVAELSRRLRHADAIIGNLALLDVYGRVARKLKDLAEKEGEEIEDGVMIRERPTQQELAGMIGTSRETVSRALSDFARRGFLEMNGKRILLRRSFLMTRIEE